MDDSPLRPTPETADRLLHADPPPRVLVVGDAMLDRYVTGSVDRISPEAPVPVVRVDGERTAPGGAANVAAGVAALGGRCRLVAARGDDGAGEALEGLLADREVDASGLVVEAGRPTTVKSRVLARHQQMLRVDRESSRPLGEEAGAGLRERVREGLDWADVVALADYDKGVLSGGLGARLAGDARAAGVPCVVDPKLRSFFDYGRTFLFKPNGRELAAAVGAERPPSTAAELEGVRAEVGCRHLLVTLGEAGMVLLSEGEDGPWEIPSEAREVYDVTGAGDTVTAVLAAGVGASGGVREVAALANFAAGLEVSHLGAVPVTREEILAALEGGDGDGAEAGRSGHRRAPEAGRGAPGHGDRGTERP